MIGPPCLTLEISSPEAAGIVLSDAVADALYCAYHDILISAAVTQSATTGTAIDTGAAAAWHAGSLVKITHTASSKAGKGVAGQNGAGGNGGYADGFGAPVSATAGGAATDGETGGTCFVAQRDVYVDNDGGTLTGGDGGDSALGGGGGGGNGSSDGGDHPGGGGGGGAGNPPGTGGHNVAGIGFGSDGTSTTGGAGYPSGSGGDSQRGGDGGNPGAAGTAGTSNGRTAFGTGAAAGANSSAGAQGNSVDGDAFITWIATGTRSGPVS